MKNAHLFARNSRADYPVAVAGDGGFLSDDTGKRYLDASGGAAVSCLGHSDAAVRAAIANQAQDLAYAHTAFFTSEAAQALSSKLANLAPAGINRVYLVSSGSEAMEAAIKLARQYFVEIGQPSRHRIIARRQSYHGNTLGALAAGGNQWRRRQFEPLLVETSLIAPCYAYRDQQQGESAEAYGRRVADELETEILRIGAENVMAFLAEPVVGATAGAVTAVPGYFARIREICDRYGVLVILDEVMCGMGRTGTLFASEAENIIPDIVAIAKGLGAGYQPIGAMLCQDFIHDAIEQGTGFFQHGHTYLGHPTACAAACATIDYMVEHDLSKRAENLGAEFSQQFPLDQLPSVRELRQIGLMIGIELKSKATPVLHALLDEGVIALPAGPTVVRLLPPLTIEEADLVRVIDALKKVL